MQSDNAKDEEPINGPSTSPTRPASAVKQSRALGLSGLRRKLSEKELCEPGTRKMMLNLLDAYEAENRELKSSEQELRRKDKELAVLKARYLALMEGLAVKSLFTIAGSALIGFIPFLYDKGVGWVVLLVVFLMSLIFIGIPYAKLGREKMKGRSDED